MSYDQITHADRIRIATLRGKRFSIKNIAKEINKHRSSVYRELKRNRCKDGRYRAEKAIWRTNGRRVKSRVHSQFNLADFDLVCHYIRKKWSPEQVSGYLKRKGLLRISHQTIYKYIWLEKRYEGDLYKSLRQSGKRRWKCGGGRKGVLRGKRPLEERPKSCVDKSLIGHFEIDTVWGTRDKHSIVTMVDRKTKYTLIGKISNRTTRETNACLEMLIEREMGRVKTATSDNGTEFHGYEEVEKGTGVKFYFCKPYHSWERGLNENTNGLIRQWLKKGRSMKDITQEDCDSIATQLNQRPRKLLGYKAPEELYV